MTKLLWDQTGQKTYETGVDHGVLYPTQTDGTYGKGVAWNGLTTVTESPSGAESNPQYADNIKYLNLLSAEEFGATVEAFTYPDEFAICDGTAELVPGVTIGQQSRRTFGLAYRTLFGNDVQGTDYGYKLHLIYGALAAPSEKAYATVNDSPEAITFSWELTTTKVQVSNAKPTASLTINSTRFAPAKLKDLEDILYGTSSLEPRLPLPDEVSSILGVSLSEVRPDAPNASGNIVTIPTKTGVEYRIDGKKVEKTVTITKDTAVDAVPVAGYKFPDVVQTRWVFQKV